MALRVWLPLNGDLKNKGISNTIVSTMGTGVSLTENGKIGKCATFPNNCNSCLFIPGLKLQILSWCCWFYCSGEGSGTSQRILSEGRDTGSVGTNIWVSKAGTTLYWSTHKKSGQTTVNLNTWYHVALVCDNSNIYFYLNGALLSTTSYTEASDYAQSSDVFVLGKMSYNYTNTSNYFPFNGKLNDVRIYDHCLSPLEVKEISQGLVLHYKLSNSSITNFSEIGNLIPNYKEMQLGTANVETGTWRLAGSSNMTRTRVQINDSPVGACYCFQNVGIQTANDGSCYGIDSTTYFEPNTEYRISMFARIISGTEGYAGYNIYNIGQELGGSHTKIDKNYRVTPLNSDGSWTYCWYHFKTNSSATRNIYIGITTGETSVTTQMCLVRIDKWNDGMDTTKIIDSSGYGNDGILTGILETSNDTSKYQLSSFFNGSDTAIQIPYDATIWQDNFTINLWFKKDELGSKNYETLIGGPSGFEMDTRANNATTLSLYMTSTRGGNVYSPFNFGEWYMVTLVNNGTNELYYINGNLVKTIEKKSMPTGNYFIGAWQTSIKQNYKGNISDFRIYATALSAEDIATLYHTPAQIDNLQNIHTFEFQEEGNKTAIYQNGMTSVTDEMHEANAELLNTVTSGGYTPAKNIANSCTGFGYANFDNYASLGQDLAVHIECDVEWTAFTADTGGTFKGVWFQGANYEIASNSFKWAGTNYICSALNSAFSLQTISTITAAGKHHYDTITTIPASWFTTYSRSNLGWRCDYSDGTGYIDIKNLKITPLQYYNAKIGENFISANNFIEK